MVGMKTTDHRLGLGDRVSVRFRCRRSDLPVPPVPSNPPGHPRVIDVSWMGGRIIARDADATNHRTRYVVQLDDDRRVVAFDDDVRRWTLSFDLVERLERMAS